MQHATRLLIRPVVVGSFSDAEKERLRQLVAVNGRDFVAIARLMDKAPDDCRQMASRLHERTRTGRFDEEEDAQIVDAVRRLVASEGESLRHRDLSPGLFSDLLLPGRDRDRCV